MAERISTFSSEFQAAAYRNELKRISIKTQERENKTAKIIRDELHKLKKQLQLTTIEEDRVRLKEAISIKEKKMPKSKRKWSPILPGSFESSFR
ncbi:hypothetical protein [Rhodoferax bucti]|uniref:hypothetical protein n=1 Tax=Rhodoferax bucti TaxID=2576305 RepID=UPI00110A021A|nr:hypothetical protein [Rhodoferax bucti]